MNKSLYKKSKILILCYFYAPINEIGSIRPAKISKYLSRKGYNINVICIDNDKLPVDNQLNEDIKGVHVTRIPHSNMVNRFITEDGLFRGKKKNSNNKEKSNDDINRRKEHVSKKQGVKKGVNYIKSLLRQFLYNYIIQFDFYIQFKKYFKNHIEEFKEYDFVFSTFGPISSVLCGMYVKRKIKNIKWISDFRDPMTLESLPLLYNKFNKYIQDKACKKSDIITTVSHGYHKRICGNLYKEKSYVITNGFDREDSKIEISNDCDLKFSMTYVGLLYGGKRNLSPIFKAIRSLINQKIIDKSDIVFNYAGRESSVIINQACKYGLEDTILNHGQVSRKESIRLQEKSRFLVLSTWNNRGEEGVFPGKFLEYMLINKPIISVVDGNLLNSEVTSVMNEANLGVSYEAINHVNDYKKLEDYIKEEYLRYKKGLGTKFNPNKKVIDRYDYENVVNQIEELFII